MAAPFTSMANSKRSIGDMDVDEFMKSGFDSSDDSSSEAEMKMAAKKSNIKPLKKLTKIKPKQNKVESTEKNPKEISNKKAKAAAKSSNTKNSKPKKKTLDRLKEQDPEFFQFLQNEDKELLEDFESGDSDDEDEDDNVDPKDAEDSDESEDERLKKFEHDILAQSDDDSRDSDEEPYHKPPSKLEVASDESGESGDEEDKPTDGSSSDYTGKLVTLKMIKQWNEDIQKQATMNGFRNMVQAFKAAVRSTSKSDEVTQYHVEGGLVFNGIVRMCLLEIVPALQQLLNLSELQSLTQVPSLSKGKNWTKLKASVKSYLVDLFKLISSIAEPAMINVILKHLHKMVPICSVFIRLSRKLVKKCTEIWSTGEETSRVLAFLCINKMIGLLPDALLETTIKQMYMAFVKNCKFTSPTTLPLINFMQRSLVEIFLIDSVLAYQYAFIYIRQLAIHLRNAITVKKKETVQAVYNWQFIHCLGLWVKLLGTAHPSDVLQPLIYPLTQTIIGTAKLQPTSKFYPLRFHCVRALTLLSDTTNTYIPVLPFLLEIFEQVDFNKKHKTQSFKPLNFACVLKLSKAQTEEKAFKDGLIDQLYELLMDHIKCHSHSIGFPELVLPAVLQLKSFLKKCKIANYCKQIKQILDKIDENSKFITQKRKYVSFTLADDNGVDVWERKCKEEGTPVSKFYASWRVLRDKELQHEISGKDRLADVTELPQINRPKGPVKPTDKEKEEFSALFDGDDDDSEDDESRFKVDKTMTKKKVKSRADSEEDEEFDNLSDYDSDELEQLAQSASEDDDDDEEGEDDEDDDDDDDDDNDDDDSGEEVSVQNTTIRKPTINRMDRKRKLLNEGQGKDDIVKEFKLNDF